MQFSIARFSLFLLPVFTFKPLVRSRGPRQMSPHESHQTSVPEWDRQFRLVRVHHEHREELGLLRLAGIGADAVAVAGQFGEALSGPVGRHRSVVDLTADRPLEHGRVDEGGFGMRVTRRVAARAVFDEYALDALAGNVGSSCW